jgi:hypothetical protein
MITRVRSIGGFLWTAVSYDEINWTVTTHRGNSFHMGGDFSDWKLV